MNSSRTSDSAILADSGEGCSGSDLGLPYTTAGTLRRRQKKMVVGRKARRDDADFAGWVYASGVPVRLVL